MKVIDMEIKYDIQKRVILVKFEEYFVYFEVNFLNYQPQVVQKIRTSSPILKNMVWGICIYKIKKPKAKTRKDQTGLKTIISEFPLFSNRKEATAIDISPTLS